MRGKSLKYSGFQDEIGYIEGKLTSSGLRKEASRDLKHSENRTHNS